MRVHPVVAPRGVPTAEVERLLRRVAAENGATIVRRQIVDDPPLAVRWHVRSGAEEGGTLLVTAAPGRVWVAVREDPNETWATPRAALFARRLGELIADV